MSAIFLPSGRMPLERLRPLPTEDRRLAWCVLAVVVLVETAMQFFPRAMLFSPLQASVLFKQLSGYTLLALMVFAMSFGWVRRRPALARHQRLLNELHQLAGLVILMLLALHIGQQPRGFLLFGFHAMAVAVTAGAVRSLLGRRAGRRLALALLGVHISLACLVAASVPLHLYLVYAYTA
jgi:hypothetical protein